MAGNKKVVLADDVPWREVSLSWAGKVASGEPDVFFKELIGEGDICPRVQFARYEPGHYEKKHSHPVGEFLFITKGALELEDQVLGPGALIFIDKNTVYGPLKAGEKGTEFLRVEIESS